MPKLLIDILPARGHFHATLKIATLLKNAGYEVVYGTDYVLQDQIEKFGFGFEYLPDVPVVKVSFAFRIAKLKKLATYFYWYISGEKYFKTKSAVNDFHLVVNGIRPDLVLLDEQVALKGILYKIIKTKVVAFQTKPDTARTDGIPPFTSCYLPREGRGKFYARLLWESKIFSYRFNYYYNRFFTIGQDNYSILKRIARDFNIDLKKMADIERSFGVGLKDMERLIISPKAFDFPHSDKNNVFRIGPLVDIGREGKIDQPRYSKLVERIKLTKTKESGFVVYCSLGTVTNKFKKEVKIFFKKIEKVAVMNPDFLFVISTGKNFNIADLLPAPNNLFLYEYVPQVELLQYCDVMITHGGMNSITECIYNHTPMLIYPLSPHWDQPGNGARAVYHQLGLRGKLKSDSARQISQKLNTIKRKYDFFKGNVVLMKKKFDEQNKSNEIIKITDNFLTN